MQIEGYISYITSVRRYSPRTQQIYRDALERFSGHSGGAEPTADSLRSYEVMLMDAKGESPRTVNLHLSVLSGYCKWAVRRGILESNPVRAIPKPRQSKRLPEFYREDSMRDYFEQSAHAASEEELELLQALPPEDKTAVELYQRRLRRLIISLLYSTGMRRAELIGAGAESVDFSRRTILITGKGNKMREIPLTPSICEEISLYLSAASHMFGSGCGKGTPLLRTAQGGRLYPVFVERAVRQELGQVGSITGRKSPHVLRHTLASELLSGGSDLNSIKELLGHSSLAATQVYTHSSMERLATEYNKAHPRAQKTEVKNGD